MVASEVGSVSVNPEVVRAARERAALTRPDVASLVAHALERYGVRPIDADLVAAWETGRERPTVAEAEAIADACVIDYAALFAESLAPDPRRDFRGPPGGGAPILPRETRVRLSRFDRLYELSSRLALELGLAEEVNLPVLSESQVEQDIHGAAMELRDALLVTQGIQQGWDSDTEALKEWRQRTEELGVAVFAFALNVGDVRGASLWQQHAPPAVLLNSSDSIPAQTFTLIHELGHLMVHGVGGSLCDPSQRNVGRRERLANQLAAEVLVPEDWLRSEVAEIPEGLSYREWPQRERTRLRDIFNVSNAVIGIRLEDIGLVEDSGYRPFWNSPGGQPRGRARPRWALYRSYMGDQTAARIGAALSSEVLTPAEIARPLRLKASEVERIAAA